MHTEIHNTDVGRIEEKDSLGIMGMMNWYPTIDTRLFHQGIAGIAIWSLMVFRCRTGHARGQRTDTLSKAIKTGSSN